MQLAILICSTALYAPSSKQDILCQLEALLCQVLCRFQSTLKHPGLDLGLRLSYCNDTGPTSVAVAITQMDEVHMHLLVRNFLSAKAHVLLATCRQTLTSAWAFWKRSSRRSGGTTAERLLVVCCSQHLLRRSWQLTGV